MSTTAAAIRFTLQERLVAYGAVVDGERQRRRALALGDAEQDAVQFGGAELELDVGRGAQPEVRACVVGVKDNSVQTRRREQNDAL